MVEGQRSRDVRNMSARAELGTLVRMARVAGARGSARLRAASISPSSVSWRLLCSNSRSTVVKLGRMSSTCTVRLARASQKLSLPTTVTPSPSFG